MPIVAKAESNQDFKLPPAGTHLGRCIWVIDLGTQDGSYEGVPNSNRKLMLTFELPEEKEIFKEGGKPEPFVINVERTLSLGEKASLRADLESWRGQPFTEDELLGFDVSKLAGVPCILSVIHKTSTKGKTYAKVTTISKIMKGTVCPPQINDKIIYSVEDRHNTTFLALPEWIRKKIEKSHEFQAMGHPKEEGHGNAGLGTPSGNLDGTLDSDDIPFAPNYL